VADVNVDDTLFALYRAGWRQNLGLSVPNGSCPWREYDDWEAFCLAELDDSTRRRVEEGRRSYERTTAPGLKLGPLLLGGATNLGDVRRLLDVGSGSGWALRYLRDRFPDWTVAGVEPELEAAEASRHVAPEAPIYSDIAAVPVGETFDLVCCVHTLHHVDPREHLKLLQAMRRCCKVGGLLYLYEDGGTDGVWLPSSRDRPKSQLKHWSRRELSQLYLAHERFANRWFYGRCLLSWAEGYRPLRDWHHMVEDAGFVVRSAGAVAWDWRRLHSVPSCWLIAQVTAAT